MRIRLDKVQIGDQHITYDTYYMVEKIEKVETVDGVRIRITSYLMEHRTPRVDLVIFGEPNLTMDILPRDEPIQPTPN